MNATSETFGPQLKEEREKRGLTLEEIAASTKIKASLLADLERNDFSKWPQGIFRRAHLCDYVCALGLPSQPILAEYQRLFPEAKPLDAADALPTDHPFAAQAPVAEYRCTLLDRAWVVGFELSIVILVSSAVAAAFAVSLPWAIALVAVAFSAVGTLCFSTSVGAHIQRRVRLRRQEAARSLQKEAVDAEVKMIATLRERAPADRRDEPGVERDDDQRASA